MKKLVVTFVMIASGIFGFELATRAQTRTRANLNFSHPVRHVMALMEKVRARLALSLRFYLRI